MMKREEALMGFWEGVAMAWLARHGEGDEEKVTSLVGLYGQFFILIFCSLLLAGCSGRSAPRSQEASARSGGVDVTVNGKQLYGILIEYPWKDQGGLSRASSVLVMPSAKRPKCSVWLEGDTTVMTINGSDYRIKGRHVCETDGMGTSLKVYPGQVPLEAYTNQATLDRAVVDKVSRAELSGAANDIHSIRSETDPTSEAGTSRR